MGIESTQVVTTERILLDMKYLQKEVRSCSTVSKHSHRPCHLPSLPRMTQEINVAKPQMRPQRKVSIRCDWEERGSGGQ